MKILYTIYDVFKQHGLKFPVIVASRVIFYCYYKIFRSNKTFIFNNKKYKYVYALYNATFRNERRVELSLALNTFPLSLHILEVGNVLQNYSNFSHTIVDKYEKGNNVISQDIIDFNPNTKYDLIISVSTFEHVGIDETEEQNEEKAEKAINYVKSLLTPNGKMIITIPIGHNRKLEEAFIQNRFNFTFTKILYMKRLNKQNDWIETTQEEALKCTENLIYPNANAIIVGLYE